MKKVFGKIPSVSALGPVNAPTPGRTDLYDKDVPEGSYVLPADIVSALGDGNSLAGHQRIDQLFPTGKKAAGLIKHAKIPKLAPKFAAGGAVPITVAGGEYLLSPEQVALVGDGDSEAGKDILDQFVQHVRQAHIDTLSELPPPKGADDMARGGFAKKAKQ